MNDKIQKLSELGAGDFCHIDGNLLDHLRGTQRLLNEWSATQTLQDAGLYHAAYGTAAFNEALVTETQRRKISEIIGSEAEQIVYLYCACDRDYFWPQMGEVASPEYKNRFTGELIHLSPQQLLDYCELTVANEIEIATDNPSFVEEHGQYLYSLFRRMRDFLTISANASVERIIGYYVTQ